MAFLEIFLLACMPVLRVLVLCGLGTFLASSRINILPGDARKHLNTLVLFVFTPALIFSSLARSVTIANMIAWWYLPFNILCNFLLGGCLGWVVVKLCKPEPHLERLTIACCAAGNFGNLLLVLVPAVCTESNSPFGETQSCITNGVAYVSFGLWMGVLLLWTFVYSMLAPPSHQRFTDLNKPYPERTEIETKNYELNAEKEYMLLEMTDIQLAESANTGEASYSKRRLIIPSSSPNKDSEPVQLSSGGLRSILRWFISRTGSIVSIMKRFSMSLHLRQVLSPPTVAVAIALFVGAIPNLKKNLFGEEAPLRFLEESVNLLGNAMIPSMTLVLGGNFSQGSGSTGMNTSIIIGILATRLLVLPVIGVALIRGASYLGLLYPDRLFRFVLMMQFTMPTAMNMGTITQHFGSCESESAMILFWSYVFSIMAITSWTMVYIWILF